MLYVCDWLNMYILKWSLIVYKYFEIRTYVYVLCYFNISSSFDEYVHEVSSGRLEWSPVHKSEKFWVGLKRISNLVSEW